MRISSAHAPAGASIGRWFALAVTVAVLGVSIAASAAGATTLSSAISSEPCPFIACEDIEGTYIYQFAWNGIPSAKCEVVVSVVEANRQPYYFFEGTARTSRFADIFWKFRAHGVALVDALTGRAKEIHVSEAENAILEESVTVFNHESAEAYYVRWKRGRSKNKTISLEGGIIDLPNLGLTIGCQPLDVGDSGSLKVLIGEDPYTFDYRVTGRERVRAARNEFDSLRIVPTFRKIEVEQKNKPRKVREMTVWLRGSEPHIPLRMKSRTFIGYVTGRLIEFRPASGSGEEESVDASSLTRDRSRVYEFSRSRVPDRSRVCASMGGHRMPEEHRRDKRLAGATFIE